MKELISEEKVKDIVASLADRINRDYDSVHLVGILKGCVVFIADLMMQLTIPVTIDFMTVVSYAGSESTGEVKILKDLGEDIAGKKVLIIEDIVDTGATLEDVFKLLSSRNPESLEICTLLDKPSRRIVPVTVKYIGIEIPDVFVVGRGIDHSGRYRNLPYLATVPYRVKVKKQKLEDK